MAAGDIVPVPGTRFEDTLDAASPDLLREMIRGFAQRMMDDSLIPRSLAILETGLAAQPGRALPELNGAVQA